MRAQKMETEELLASLRSLPRRKIDQSPEAQLERLRARYTRLARVGGFDPPSQNSDADGLRQYWYQNKARLEDADILDEIERMAPQAQPR